MRNNLTTAYASEIGCALDCVPHTQTVVGGGPATDDGPTISGFLSASTATSPACVMLDGWMLSTGVFTSAGGDIAIIGQGRTTGISQKSASNNDVIHNGGPTANVPTDPGALTSNLPMTPPTRSGSMLLKDFCIDGNKYGNSTSGQVQGIGNFIFPPTPGALPGSGSNGLTWYFGVNVMNMVSATLDGMDIMNTSSFATRFSNVGTVRVVNSRISPADSPIVDVGNNGDGVHVSGYCDDVYISNTYFHTSDDAIGINSVEGYCGPIQRVVVDNCTFDSCQSALRIYCNGRYDSTNKNVVGYIETFMMSNCAVTSLVYVMIIGLAVPGPRYNIDQIQHAIFTGNRFYGNYGVAFLCDNVGLLQFNDCVWTAPQQSGFGIGFVNMVYDGATVSQMEFNNVTIDRSSYSAGGPYVHILQMGIEIPAFGALTGTNATGGPPAHRIRRLVLNGVRVAIPANDVSALPIPFLLNIETHCIITEIVIENVDSSGINALYNPALPLDASTRIGGPGVLATGWAIPDVYMLDRCPYISATDNLPSIKIGGVVKKYNLT